MGSIWGLLQFGKKGWLFSWSDWFFSQNQTQTLKWLPCNKSFLYIHFSLLLAPLLNFCLYNFCVDEKYEGDSFVSLLNFSSKSLENVLLLFSTTFLFSYVKKYFFINVASLLSTALSLREPELHRPRPFRRPSSFSSPPSGLPKSSAISEYQGPRFSSQIQRSRYRTEVR